MEVIADKHQKRQANLPGSKSPSNGLPSNTFADNFPRTVSYGCVAKLPASLTTIPNIVTDLQSDQILSHSSLVAAVPVCFPKNYLSSHPQNNASRPHHRNSIPASTERLSHSMCCIPALRFSEINCCTLGSSSAPMSMPSQKQGLMLKYFF